MSDTKTVTIGNNSDFLYHRARRTAARDRSIKIVQQKDLRTQPWLQLWALIAAITLVLYGIGLAIQ